jgi:hypothetical protein
MASRQEAKEMVKKANKYGHLDEDILSQLDTESRRKIEHEWAILESVAGQSVQTLVSIQPLPPPNEHTD